MMVASLGGKVALVTGAGQGVGQGIAFALAAAGARVALFGRTEAKLDATAQQISVRGGAALSIAGDVCSAADLEHAVARTCEELGGVDILVNNAGGQFPAMARDISPRGWRAVVDLNLNGTFLTMSAVRPHMERGCIVTVMSNQIDRGGPGVAHSAAARAGVANLTRSLAVEWAPAIRVNAVAPGFFATKGAQEEMLHDAAVGEALVGGIPAGRLGEVSEVADAVTFLASPAASYVTGAVLYVDGGNVLGGGLMPLQPLWAQGGRGS